MVNNPSNLVSDLRRLAASEGFDVLADAANALEQLRPWLVWSVDSPGPQWQLDRLLAQVYSGTQQVETTPDHDAHATAEEVLACRLCTPHRKWPGEPPHCPSCSCGLEEKASAQCPHQTRSGLDCMLQAGHDGPHSYAAQAKDSP